MKNHTYKRTIIIVLLCLIFGAVAASAANKVTGLAVKDFDDYTTVIIALKSPDTPSSGVRAFSIWRLKTCTDCTYNVIFINSTCLCRKVSIC